MSNYIKQSHEIYEDFSNASAQTLHSVPDVALEGIRVSALAFSVNRRTGLADIISPNEDSSKLIFTPEMMIA